MNISFNKNIDLLLGLQYYVKQKLGISFDWVKSNYPKYDIKFIELCDNYLSEKFIDYIKNYGLDSYSGTVRIALALNDNYEVVENENIINIKETNSVFNSALLANYLNEFISKSNYNDFYNSTLEDRNYIINELHKAINYYGIFSPNIIESFYGYSKGKMNIIIANFSQGSYGENDENGSTYVCGMSAYLNDHFDPYILSNLFHEFSHPYINPLGEKYFGDVKLSNLFNNAKENGLESCYNLSLTMLNEYVVRAVQIYLGSKYFDEEVNRKIIEKQKKRGYVFIEDVIALFDKKNNYSNFEKFYKNEIVTFFMNLNNNIK